MCMDHRINCKCGSSSAGFNFKNEVLPVKVVNGLYCPRCSSDIKFDHHTMMADNGWVIEYDMEVAEAMKSRLPTQKVSPEFIFDEGYCTWRGVYPTDHVDSVRERMDLIKLSKEDPIRYLQEFKNWGKLRMERLAKEGWRKAQ